MRMASLGHPARMGEVALAELLVDEALPSRSPSQHHGIVAVAITRPPSQARLATTVG